MPSASSGLAASRRFLSVLAAISAVTVATVLLWTRGTSRQLAVESRLPELARLARAHAMPVAPLVAACIAEAHREAPRADAAVAAVLAEARRQHADDEGKAMRALFEDPVEARMAADLLAENRDRWTRLMTPE